MDVRDLWPRWKRQWRRLEKAAAIRLGTRRIRQLLGTELRHFVEVRCAVERFGDWSVAPAYLPKGSVVYSFGVGDDIGLDLALIEKFGVEVHAFDPTPKAIAWLQTQKLPSQFHFHPLGIADYDGTADFSAPTSDPRRVSYRMLELPKTAMRRVAGEVRRLPTILNMLGHEHIDLLKLDIEGAEYSVLDDLLRSGITVRQLLVEFHHRWPGVGQPRTRRAVEMLQDAGYRITSISPPGWEYSFIKIPAPR